MNLLFPKVPSGIPGLDKMIGGGFTKNNLIVVSGTTGSGRTTFATQFLVNGFRQNQEPGIYLSFNEPKYSIFANMSAYDWNLPELERNKQVVFIEYPQTELGSFVEQEGSILELIDTLGVERVVFDSITPLAMLSDGDERVRSLQKLVNTVRKWGVTTLITADDITPPDPDLPRTNVGIEAMADGFIHLGWMREGNRRLRTLEVVKMRGSAHAHLIHLTTIDSQGYRLVEAEVPENAATGAAQAPKAGIPGPKAQGAGAELESRMKTAPTGRSTLSGQVRGPAKPAARKETGIAPAAHAPVMTQKKEMPARTGPLSETSKLLAMRRGVGAPGIGGQTASGPAVRPPSPQTGRMGAELSVGGRGGHALASPVIRPVHDPGHPAPKSNVPFPKPPPPKKPPEDEPEE